MTDPLWDEFDRTEHVRITVNRYGHRPRLPHRRTCADGDHTPTTIRPYGGPPIFTACTTCGLRLPFDPDA